MRRTILLLATAALALLLVGGVAASKQPQEQSTTSSNSPTATPDKSGGDVSIESSSTTPKASFTNGTGANLLRVKVSDHGNLMGFESPSGQEAVGSGEGYVLCSTGTIQAIHGHDTGAVEAGFGTATFSQPNGSGTFPLTVTRNTTDGKFQLKQVWAKPDTVEKDVTVTMTLKNISSAPFSHVILDRTGDFDVGLSSNDQGARTNDSAWQWDESGIENPAGGLQLTALTFGSTHYSAIENWGSWVGTPGGSRTGCSHSPVATPTARGDFVMRVGYELFNLGAGQSKTVKFEYGRF